MTIRALAAGFAALCLAGAAAAESRTKERVRETRTTTTYTHYWAHPGDRDRDPDFLRFTPAPDLREEAGKVADIVTANRLEVADLRSMGGSAQTAGFENIHSIYMDMVPDHERIASMGEGWLANYGFNIRTETTTATTAASISPEGSVDAMLAHHEMVFNEMLDKAHHEDSLYVRGLELLTAATAARHASELRWLNKDVDAGSKTMTADLEMYLNNTRVAGSRQSTETK